MYRHLSYFSYFTARLLAKSGAEGLPCSSALWESGHKHTWKWLPCGQDWTLLQVIASSQLKAWWEDLLPPMNDDTNMCLFCLCDTLCRHGWNLTVLPNNSGSILRHLGAVPGESVIVVLSGRKDIPLLTVKFLCWICHHFSLSFSCSPIHRGDYSLAEHWHGLFYLMLVTRPKPPSIHWLLTHWCWLHLVSIHLLFFHSLL